MCIFNYLSTSCPLFVICVLAYEDRDSVSEGTVLDLLMFYFLFILAVYFILFYFIDLLIYLFKSCRFDSSF
jgi:hypothetical protein